jgi:hypothetical protein
MQLNHKLLSPLSHYILLCSVMFLRSAPKVTSKFWGRIVNFLKIQKRYKSAITFPIHGYLGGYCL